MSCDSGSLYFTPQLSSILLHCIPVCYLNIVIKCMYSGFFNFFIIFLAATASPKEVSLISLLDDISEALRHRVAHETDAASLPSFAKETSTPEWSSVLTDVMLSLCVEPWRLLREVVGATFGRIVAKGELFAPSIKLSMFEHAEKTGTEDDGSLSPLQLILSIADGKSRAAQERVAVAGEEEDEEDTGASSEDDLSNEAQREDIGKYLAYYSGNISFPGSYYFSLFNMMPP